MEKFVVEELDEGLFLLEELGEISRMVFCCLFKVMELSVRLKHNSGELGSDLGVIPRFSESERCDLDWGLETEFGGDLLDCGL